MSLFFFSHSYTAEESYAYVLEKLPQELDSILTKIQYDLLGDPGNYADNSKNPLL